MAGFTASGFAGPRQLMAEVDMNRLARALAPSIDAGRRAESFYSAVSPGQGSDEPVETYYDGHRHDATIGELAGHPALAEAAAALLGGPVKIWRTTFWIKAPGARRVEWHQDTYKDEGLGSFPNVNAWIAIDEATPANCMHFVHGTHQAIVALERFKDADYIARLEQSDALPRPPVSGEVVAMPLKPGQYVLFDGRILHGSPPNLSPRRRAGLVVRFIPRDFQLNHKTY